MLLQSKAVTDAKQIGCFLHEFQYRYRMKNQIIRCICHSIVEKGRTLKQAKFTQFYLFVDRHRVRT